MSTAIAPIQGTTGADILTGDLGNDNIYGGAGEDILFGGEGDDNLRGGSGSDHLYGGAGNDMLNGDDGADIMEGGLGDDTYVVDDAGDQVIEAGGEGYDSVKASISYTLTANVERLDLMGAASLNGTGNNLDNTIKGNSGDNILSGLAGKDSLTGGDGHDTLIGGAGHDWLQGGAGSDDFMLAAVGATETAGSISTKTLNSTSSDAITDFTHGVDRIVVQASDYTGVNVGVLDASNFVAGTAATAAHAQFIYDAAHKALLYDADGTGSGVAVKIADINAGATVTASDIFVHASAFVLDFEDLNANAGGAPMPANYHGYTFTDLNGGEPMYVLDGTGYGSAGYAVAGTAVAFNPFYHAGIDLKAANGGEFVFSGVDLTSAWNDTQDVIVHGFLNGVEVYTGSVSIDNQHVTHFVSGSSQLIDDLKFEISSHGGEAYQTVFDNIAVSSPDTIIPHG